MTTLAKTHAPPQARQRLHQSEILLESGTNEVEFIEFYVKDQSFGVNVAKVREIVQYHKELETPVPGTPPSVRGTLLLRGHAITLIDLRQQLFHEPHQAHARSVALITDFNNMITGFLVDGVNRIHRRSWNDLKPINPHLAALNTHVTGSVQIEEKDVLVLDLEGMIGAIMPSSQVGYLEHIDKNTTHQDQLRANLRLIYAEDSPFIRANIERHLKSNGYRNLHVCANGFEALQLVASLAQQAKNREIDLRELVSAVVTDIEMPKLDGLTLCRRIREELGQSNLPVVVLSSLINEHVGNKCRSVGCSAFLNKAHAEELISTLDQLCLEDV